MYAQRHLLNYRYYNIQYFQIPFKKWKWSGKALKMHQRRPQQKFTAHFSHYDFRSRDSLFWL